MFQKILVPTDFSQCAKKTLVCLTAIPWATDLILLHVIDGTHYTRRGWTHEPEIENAKIQLREEKGYLERAGKRVKDIVRVITGGTVASEILEVAREEQASVIVMGCRGRNLISGLLLGSVSAGVLRHGKTPLLIIRDSVAEHLEGRVLEKYCSGIFTRVLCPTDFSEPARAALESLKGLEGIREAVLVHVVTRGETREEIAGYVQEASKNLKDLQAELEASGIPSSGHIRLGRPTDEINRLAAEEDVSLILMSSHGKGLLKEILLGSTTFGIAIHTDRPLLVVRAQPAS